MRLQPVVDRLSAQCPGLRQVLPALSAAVPTAYPAAYVLPLSERVADADLGSTAHAYEARFAVEIMVRNAANHATGGPAAQDMETLRESVLDALVGHAPGEGYTPVAHVSGKLVAFEAGLAVWRDEFTVFFVR